MKGIARDIRKNLLPAASCLTQAPLPFQDNAFPGGTSEQRAELSVYRTHPADPPRVHLGVVDAKRAAHPSLGPSPVLPARGLTMSTSCMPRPSRTHPKCHSPMNPAGFHRVNNRRPPDPKSPQTGRRALSCCATPGEARRQKAGEASRCRYPRLTPRSIRFEREHRGTTAGFKS